MAHGVLSSGKTGVFRISKTFYIMELLTRSFDNHLFTYFWHFKKCHIIANLLKLKVRIDCSIKVFIEGNCDGTAKEVKDDDVGDVELGEEPPVVLGPVGHDRMP